MALVLGDEVADLGGRRTAGPAAVVLLIVCTLGPVLWVDPAWIGVSLTAGLLVVGGLLLWAARRRERRIQRLLDQVASEVPSAG